MTTFDIPPITFEPPLSPREKRRLRPKKKQTICEWVEENITLVKPSYLYDGPFKAWKWQVEPMNAFMYWKKLLYIGAVQTFKSGITDMQAMYTMSELELNIMIAYVNKDKVTDAFEDRYIPMIKATANKVLNSIWDGKDDSLTKNKLKLMTSTCKIASANTPDDMASFTAPITFGSEVGKWKHKPGRFDPVQLLRGRSDAGFSGGDIIKNVLESSPFEVGDPLYNETFREGTLILQPHYQCPHCGHWQTLTDHQIRLRSDTLKGKSAKIRELGEEACAYICILCGDEITEAQRSAAADKVVWAKPHIEEEDIFLQEAEEIRPDGSIEGRKPNGKRNGYDLCAYWWNRLVDVAFPFSECLARFFETKHDLDKKKSYENETMARWWRKKTGRIEKKYLESRKLETYFQWGENHAIPDEVLYITLGVDTQKTGFYYTFVGWGPWLAWDVLRQGFITCPTLKEGYSYEVFEKFMAQLYAEPLRWKDSTQADFNIGFIDRGGHRAKDVDYITKHFPKGKLLPYIGATRVDATKPLVYKGREGTHFMGQTESISEDVGAIMAGENFWLPNDVDDAFITQIGRQFRQKKIDPLGSVKEVWVHNFQGDDHYRDCLNLAYAAGVFKGIDKALVNPKLFDTLGVNKAKVKPPEKEKPKEKPKEAPRRGNRGGYFNNLGGRLR